MKNLHFVIAIEYAERIKKIKFIQPTKLYFNVSFAPTTSQ